MDQHLMDRLDALEDKLNMIMVQIEKLFKQKEPKYPDKEEEVCY